MTTINDSPKVYEWGEDLLRNEINTDSITQTIDWITKFSGNFRLSGDVGLPLERCVVGCYQIGYLFDYAEKDPRYNSWEVNSELSNVEEHNLENAMQSYWEEGIASVLIHVIASYQMMGRDTVALEMFNNWNVNSWDYLVDNHIIDEVDILYHLSEFAFKYQRWMLYNHMGRTKRWNENEFKACYTGILMECLTLTRHTKSKISRGFTLAMSKLQDGEIKRH